MSVTPEVIRERLKTILDPELGVDIVTLGLLYDIAIEDGKVGITMTLTAPGCPLGEEIKEQVAARIGSLDGVRDTEVNIVWTPPWDPSRIEDPLIRSMLGGLSRERIEAR